MEFNKLGTKELFSKIIKAENQIRNYIRHTPLEYSHYLSEKADAASVYLKMENIQFTGSFKVRGAFNKLLSLSDPQKHKGIITASTGNHGAAVAYALDKLGLEGTIYLPQTVQKNKVEKLRQYSTNLIFHGIDPVETEKFARKQAKLNEIEYISPYNDPDIIAGQGTIGIELVNDLTDIDNIFVTIGGGGMISGIATYLRKEIGNVKIIGCLPNNSPVMYESIKAGTIIEMETKETLSDGSAGGIEKGAITFDLCKELVDEYLLVSEEEIEEAIQLIFQRHRQVIEGAAGVAVAGYLNKINEVEGKSVIVLCGGNISIPKFKEIIMKD